jgi:signal transduction histidine kinase
MSDPRAGQAPKEAPGPERLGKLCHDLNNPLAVIMGQLEIITERHPDLAADLAERLAEIGKSGEVMRRLILDAGQEARRAMGED